MFLINPLAEKSRKMMEKKYFGIQPESILLKLLKTHKHYYITEGLQTPASLFWRCLIFND